MSFMTFCRFIVVSEVLSIVSVSFANLSPHADNESSDSESYDDCNDDEAYDEMQKQILVDRTLTNPSTSQALGEWERYTKGFGSKMLQKFGYVLGTGLGNNGEGIVDPKTNSSCREKSGPLHGIKGTS